VTADLLQTDAGPEASSVVQDQMLVWLLTMGYIIAVVEFVVAVVGAQQKAVVQEVPEMQVGPRQEEGQMLEEGLLVVLLRWVLTVLAQVLQH